MNELNEHIVSERMHEGVKLCERFLAGKKTLFADVKPSDIPEEKGVYTIFDKDTGEALYVGRTKNLRQRLYNNHLHGPITNARLKKYLIDDQNKPDISNPSKAKDYLKRQCYFQFVIEEDLMKRGQMEGLLSFLLNVRYLYEEH